MGKLNFIKLEVVFKTCTQNAVLFAYEGEEIWCPRSNLGIRSDMAVEDMERGQEVELSVAEWWANTRGLI